MQRSTCIIQQLHCFNLSKQNILKISKLKMDDVETIANVKVTVDGIWPKRGHSSKTGVVFLLSVVTAENLDYKVKSLICHECRAYEQNDKDSG